MWLANHRLYTQRGWIEKFRCWSLISPCQERNGILCPRKWQPLVNSSLQSILVRYGFRWRERIIISKLAKESWFLPPYFFPYVFHCFTGRLTGSELLIQKKARSATSAGTKRMINPQRGAPEISFWYSFPGGWGRFLENKSSVWSRLSLLTKNSIPKSFWFPYMSWSTPQILAYAV